MIICLGSLIILDKTLILVLNILHYYVQETTQFTELFDLLISFLFPILVFCMFILLPSIIILYTYFTTKSIKIKRTKITYQRIASFGTILLIFYPLTYLIPFIFSTGLLRIGEITPTDILGRVSIELLSFALSSLLMSLFLKKIIQDYSFNELRNIGFIFLFISTIVFIYHFFLIFLDFGWFIIDIINVPSVFIQRTVDLSPINIVLEFPFLLNFAYLIVLSFCIVGSGTMSLRRAEIYLRSLSIRSEIIKDSDITQKEELVLPENQVFFSSVRFTIMLILTVHTTATFSEIQNLLNLTPGRLDYHLNQLVTNNLIIRKKAFISQRPLTVIKITEEGITSFKKYANQMQDLLGKVT
ncbi:MAG: transcriptional regulator [Candidatus Hodarchaeota archaeon]